MASTYREGRPRTSVAWDHFEIKDRERSVATCNICHDAFSYRTSVSNLMKHLKTKHGYSVVKGEEDDENDGACSLENDGKSEPQQKIKTELWEYYEVKDEANKLAMCNICLDQFSFASTLANLFKHLKNKHSIDFGRELEIDNEEQEKDEDDVTLASMTDHRTSNKSSVAWEYFEIKDEGKKVAACIQCGALCSYKSSVSNLMKHARRKHGVQDDFNGTTDEDAAAIEAITEATESALIAETSSGTRAQRSIVWLYFKCIDADAKISQCLLCHKTLSHSSTLTNLKKHLARKHPNVKIPTKEDGRKRILLSSGGELFEVETISKCDDDDDDSDDLGDTQNETLEMNTVYLEDFDTLQQEQETTKTKNPTAKPRKRKYSSSSEEEITFINRYVKKPSDSFDHFGKYVASLLRKLPLETSNRLQVDFLKQIMSAETNSVNVLMDEK